MPYATNDDAEKNGGAEVAPRGLTDREVAERLADGRANVNTDVRTKSVPTIVREHVLTLFNGVNLFLALVVASTGQYRNLLFMLVVLANLVIGVFQEVRSKLTIDRLSILAERPVRVVRASGEAEVAASELVLDDLVRLSHGDQVPADSVILTGDVLMDESLLTGESRLVRKEAGDELLSGSFVSSGSLLARVTRVGADGFAAKINAEAKYVKPVRSEILETLRMIIRLGTSVLLPLGGALFARTLLDGATPQGAALTTVAAVVGMIPQGLVLLTSTVLAIATTRLARSSVLVQQLYCIETLARVDVLCLDKTGTITTGAMEVSSLLPETPNVEDDLLRVLGLVARANEADANDTSRAIAARVPAELLAGEKIVRVVPFSSARKYSGCVLADGTCLVMGASQFVLGDAFAAHEAAVRSFDSLERVLVACEVDGFDDGGAIVGAPRVVGFVGIRDQVRDTAAWTVAYFVEQGVTLNVISGDDPATVSAIAASVGVPGAERWVDATTLDTPEKLVRAAADCHVFGRVTPQQKRELVRILQEAGHTVAMTGDGVNDVLALKRADCSVAMASGSDAARNVAEVVLVDNDFAHMPEVVAEGRRSINNLQRSASLFLVKTVFSAALAFVCVFFPPYPFLPVQMALVSAGIIGIPSFVLALEPNHDRVRGRFLANVLSRSMPASIAILGCLALTLLVGRHFVGWDFRQISTVCTMLAAVVGITLIVRISVPLSTLRKLLLCFVIAFMASGFTWAGPFFSMATPSVSMLLHFVLVACLGVFAFNHLSTAFAADLESSDGAFSRLVDRIEEREHERNHARVR